jgi:drug/metabolite transporter (DMT)-like permease
MDHGAIDDTTEWLDVLGILLALGAAASGAVYYAVAKTVRARMDFLLFVWVG